MPSFSLALRRVELPVIVTVGFITALMSAVVVVGADTMWLVAMGKDVWMNGGIPQGVPFAHADTSTWTNLPVVAELVFAGLHHLSPLGLPAAQILVGAVTLLLLARGARDLGAEELATSITLALVALGSLPAFGVIRAQLLSLVPFALLVLLLRAEEERPSRRIWLLIPLIALWGNLHGAVLAGVAVAGCYLVLSRARQDFRTALAVSVGIVGSLFANPALHRTPNYYLGVLSNEAAQRGTELWSRPSFEKPFDVLMLASALLLVGAALSRRRPMWEYVALLGLVVGTASAARHGLWLLLFAMAPAAAAVTRSRQRMRTRSGQPRRDWGHLPALLAIGLGVASVFLLWTRTDQFSSEGSAIAAVKIVAQTSPVLATEPLAESLAAAGVTVWASNPIDAFSQEDQAAYLDFLAGAPPSSNEAFVDVRIAVAPTDSASASIATRLGFGLVMRVGGYDLLERQRGNDQ